MVLTWQQWAKAFPRQKYQPELSAYLFTTMLVVVNCCGLLGEKIEPCIETEPCIFAANLSATSAADLTRLLSFLVRSAAHTQ